MVDNLVDHYKCIWFNFPDENFLVVEDEEESNEDIWTLCFNGAVNIYIYIYIYGNGVGVLLSLLIEEQYLVPIKLQFKCTNNIAKYKACIHRLEETLEMKVEKLDVCGNFLLIIC